jgi:hypothetical protein
VCSSDLYNNNTFVETGFDGSTYAIDVVNADNLVVETLELSDQMGSLFLSEPITVKVVAENSYATAGLRYVNGQIVRP